MSESDQKRLANPDVVREVKVRLNASEFKPSVYANFFALQPGGEEVIMSFFEAWPPIVAEGNDESAPLLQDRGISAECVARITVNRKRFIEFADLMTKVAEVLRSESK